MAVTVQVLEELVTRQLLAPPDDTRQLAIRDVDDVALPALPAKLEAKGRAVDCNVARVQRRQAERTVRRRILGVADADERRLEQSHHRRHDLLPRQPPPGK